MKTNRNQITSGKKNPSPMHRAAISILVAMMASTIAKADLQQLKNMSLEALMDVQVTSVSRRQQRLSDAASAVFVISQEDIYHSGATSIPELLRMVPGVNVARVDANSWAVTARGLNGLFANKLLVLMDGRSIYSPTFSGVYWSVQDTILEDIERIEVIRGPGASVWGSNAVNGVINIITKSAMDTQGTLVTAGVGSEELGFGSVRQGGEFVKDGYYRLYAKYFNRDDAVFSDGSDAADGWDSIRAGFRTDWQHSLMDSFTIQGDIYQGDAGQTVTEPSLSAPYMPMVNRSFDFQGTNLLARWERKFDDDSSRALQFYYDRVKYTGQRNEDRQSLDLEYKFHLVPRGGHDLVMGVGYRYTWDELEATDFRLFEPVSRHDQMYSAFIQDEISLIEDTLYLTLGSKFEHNDYTGFEVQPTARLLWHPKEEHSLWLAVSRAVRTPNRSEHDTTAVPAVMPSPSGLPVQMQIEGNDEFDTETLIAYEAGYRMPFTQRGHFDLALFYHDYDRLRSIELVGQVPQPPTHVIAVNSLENKRSGKSYGLELALDLQPLDWWRLQAAYSWIDIKLHMDPDSNDLISEKEEGTTPEQQLSLRSSMELTDAFDLDLWVRYVDELPTVGVDDYWTLDTRIGWKIGKNFELSLVGRNLLRSQHAEFSQLVLTAPVTEVEREIYGQVTWRF